MRLIGDEKMIICSMCGLDIDEAGMDNVSPVCGHPICEACIEDFERDKEYWLKKFEQEDYEDWA